jgi:hypothetical protein
MKKVKSKKLLSRLAVMSIICAMPPFAAHGQEIAAAGELTVTECKSMPAVTGSINQITGTDNGEEIRTTTDLKKWFDADISVKSASARYSSDETGQFVTQFVADIEYGGKTYHLIIGTGSKLKYRMVGENAVILFDETYCLPEE